MDINDTNIKVPGKREVFTPYITNKYGVRIYPKNAKFFHFWVDDIPEGKVNKPQQLSMFDTIDA